jgi:hypothetical protein
MYIKIKNYKLIESIEGVGLKQGGYEVFMQEWKTVTDSQLRVSEE